MHKGLMEDDRTGLPPQKVTHLLELCLQTTYFKFQESYYEQTDGAAMESPVPPVVANHRLRREYTYKPKRTTSEEYQKGTHILRPL